MRNGDVLRIKPCSESVPAEKFWFKSIGMFRCSISESQHRNFTPPSKKNWQSAKFPIWKFREIEFAEGGILSGKRQYLRLRRERLVFDICSAPFGTSWFFLFVGP